jgi:CRP-like cAMP-binding protein
MALTTEEKRDWLAKVPLFRDCDPDTIERLAEVTNEYVAEDSQPIIIQGQVGNGLHLLVDGGARVVAGGEELARIGPGDVLGELSVIDQRPRSASAYAIGPTTCLALASWDVMSLIETEPHLAVNLLKELASRLRSADEQLSR